MASSENPLGWETVDHVQLAIPAGGEAAARAFWRELLGFAEVEKPEALRASGGLWLKAGAVALHLGVDPDFRPARKAHPALRVRRFQDLRATLDKAGVPCRDDHRTEGVARFFFDDPFGNRIEALPRD